MFRQIAAGLTGDVTMYDANADRLISEPSLIIEQRLSRLWACRARASGVAAWAPILHCQFTATSKIWDHLIYAYLVENTRIHDIFRKVLLEWTRGERLPAPRNDITYNWIRTTEELFYSYGSMFLPTSVTSVLRPDENATRRNAYFRFFGIDLNHPGEDGRPYPYEKPAIANRDFIPVFELFLKEVWRAIEHSRNSTGPNPTDRAAIADLAYRLQSMLNERRGGTPTSPNLAREEFSAVAALSWLHLIVDYDSPVVRDLQVAAAATPEERLRQIGERVGIASHARSHSYFILAPRVSRLLLQIEAGDFNQPDQVAALYLPPPPAANTLRDNIMTIVDHWSQITGRNLKATPFSAAAPLTRASASAMAGPSSPHPALSPPPALAPASPSAPNGSEPAANRLVEL
ncbi:hypothetical protein [Microbispora triticiradicis]|uniref:Uncharacterized protein n=2 Tax=Microbispora TaxID=2005 RepID=A0ABY3LUJ4_9ACTN|nr:MULTISPECIES: hypothetical protein [Microbispora]TLP52409.1 hypothetical protein FED44_32395 [Microbispora fusca]TYB55425.1 hypothetical protein FXF59_21215 [Microbispora tritici]